MAYDRCSDAVEDLLDQEEALEEALLEEIQEMQYVHEYECDYYGDTQYLGSGWATNHPQERRPSMVDIAI
jgi:hypothetical protein